MKNRLTALILTLILAGCAAAAAERNDIQIKVTETGPMPTEANADMILTCEAAEAIALSNEGLTAAQVTGLVTEYEVDDGVKEYEIDFRSGDYDYDITVNAETGKITSRDKEYDPVETVPAATEAPETEPPATEAPAEKSSTSKNTSSAKTSASTKKSSSAEKATEPKETKPRETEPKATEAPAGEAIISASKAKSIALNHAGVKSSKATNMRCEYEIDDGVKEYEVDFRSGDYEYDYTINAETGKITSHDKEYDPIETKPKETEPPATEAPAEEKISASKAKSIALNHAGVSSDEAKGMECEYDVDDGVKVYEISFRSGGYEYEYEINAVNGKIISWDKEKDD